MKRDDVDLNSEIDRYIIGDAFRERTGRGEREGGRFESDERKDFERVGEGEEELEE